MKNSKCRLMKGLGLIGMLALCLLLSGCIVPAQDLSTDGDYVVTENDLPFKPTTPTDTPYSAPTESPTPTASPTRNPYSVATNPAATNTTGGIGTAATNNPVQSITIVTNQPANTTSTTGSTTLKKGSTGSEVKKLQERLKELGYLKGSADGDFGDATENAVKNFQLQNGLTVDGVAGSSTLNKVYSATAKKAPSTTATNTPKPDSTTASSLKKGSTGSEVRKMQKRLIELGYLSGSADGDFGDATEDAVKAFQRRNGLTVDGKAGTATLDKLYSSSAKAAATATPTSKPTNTPATSLKKGDSGSEVRELQERLKELGYYTNYVDGDFGDVTEEAVKAFQRNNGLTADGKAGSVTLSKLYSSSAKYASPTATPTSKPTNTPKSTATPDPDSLDYYLEIGSSGSKVRALQNRLIQLGWLEGTASGKYDNATEYAVKAFQERYSSLWVDGIAGPDTLKMLYSSSAATSKAPAASIGVSLEEGDENDAVAAMQKRLKELGYYKSTADGEFGSVTKSALIAFQTANGLTADGKAGSTTLSKLYAADAVDAKTFAANQEDEENARDEEDPIAQEPEEATDIEVGGYTTLRRGDTGAKVKALQEALQAQGYYSGKIDSTFGSGVYTAVRAFQQKMGLKVDGVAGPATQMLLYGTQAGSSDTSTTLKQGSTGNKVRNLQYVLYELGYYDGPIDGDYGATTADAVRAFQVNNALSPVDGVAGSSTLKVLYSGNALGASAPAAAYSGLSKGDKGTLVVEMQEMLSELGYLTEVTGEYDDATVEAVKNFQRRNGLTADGKAGQKTLTVLYGSDPTPAW